MTKQFNVELPEKLTKRTKLDAVSIGVALNEYASAALENFLSKPIAARRSLLEKAKRKTLGRKIKFETAVEVALAKGSK